MVNNPNASVEETASFDVHEANDIMANKKKKQVLKSYMDDVTDVTKTSTSCTTSSTSHEEGEAEESVQTSIEQYALFSASEENKPPVPDHIFVSPPTSTEEQNNAITTPDGPLQRRGLAVPTARRPTPLQEHDLNAINKTFPLYHDQRIPAQSNGDGDTGMNDYVLQLSNMIKSLGDELSDNGVLRSTDDEAEEEEDELLTPALDSGYDYFHTEGSSAFERPRKIMAVPVAVARLQMGNDITEEDDDADDDDDMSYYMYSDGVIRPRPPFLGSSPRSPPRSPPLSPLSPLPSTTPRRRRRMQRPLIDRAVEESKDEDDDGAEECKRESDDENGEDSMQGYGTETEDYIVMYQAPIPSVVMHFDNDELKTNVSVLTTESVHDDDDVDDAEVAGASTYQDIPASDRTRSFEPLEFVLDWFNLHVCSGPSTETCPHRHRADTPVMSNRRVGMC